jgi:hypothetical protein
MGNIVQSPSLVPQATGLKLLPSITPLGGTSGITPRTVYVSLDKTKCPCFVMASGDVQVAENAEIFSTLRWCSHLHNAKAHFDISRRPC